MPLLSNEARRAVPAPNGHNAAVQPKPSRAPEQPAENAAPSAAPDKDPRVAAIERLQENALRTETDFRNRAVGTAAELKRHMREAEAASAGVSGLFSAWTGSLDAMDAQGSALARVHATQLQTAGNLRSARLESVELVNSALLLEEEGRELERRAVAFRTIGDLKNSTASLNAAQEKYNGAQLSFREAEEGLMNSLSGLGAASQQFARDSRATNEAFASAGESFETYEQRLRLVRDGCVIAGATVATGGVAAAGYGFGAAVGAGVAAGTGIGGLSNATEAGGHVAYGNKTVSAALTDAGMQTAHDAKSAAVTAVSSATGLGAGKYAGKLLGVSSQTLKGASTLGALSGGSGAAANSTLTNAERYARAVIDFNELSENIPAADRAAVWQEFAAARGVNGANLARELALDTFQGVIGGTIGGAGGAFKNGQSQVRQLAVTAGETTADGASGLAAAYGRAALDGRQFSTEEAMTLVGQTIQSSVIGEMSSRANRIQISESSTPTRSPGRTVLAATPEAPELQTLVLPKRARMEQNLTAAEQTYRNDVEASLDHYGAALGEDFSQFRVRVSPELNGSMAITTRLDARNMSFSEVEPPVLHINPNEIERFGLDRSYRDWILPHELGHELISARVPEYHQRLQAIGEAAEGVGAKLFPEDRFAFADLLYEAAADGAGYALARGHGFSGEQNSSEYARLARLENGALQAAPLLRASGDSGSPGAKIATRARIAVSLDKIAEASEGPGHDPAPLTKALGEEWTALHNSEQTRLTPAEVQKLLRCMSDAFELGASTVRPQLPKRVAQTAGALTGQNVVYPDTSGAIDPAFRRHYEVSRYNRFSDSFELRDYSNDRRFNVPRSEVVAHNPQLARLAADGESAGIQPSDAGRGARFRRGDVVSVSARSGAEPEMFSVLNKIGPDDYLVRALHGSLADQSFVVSGNRLRDNQNSGMLNAYNQFQRIVTGPLNFAADFITMARTDFKLRPMEINGRRAWVLHPDHNFVDDPRQNPSSDVFGPENKWYQAFEALRAEYAGRGETLRVVTAEDLGGNVPWVHVGSSASRPELRNYVLDHHRIRGARDCGLPIEVNISREESFN